MTQLSQGSTTVTLQDNITLPERAGTLSLKEMQRLNNARKGVGLAAEATAIAMLKDPKRLAVPEVDAEALRELGRQAELIDTYIVDVQNVLTMLRQANLLIDAEAHEKLRRVLAFVRAQEKFDPTLPALVPMLVSYFANERSRAPEPVA